MSKRIPRPLRLARLSCRFFASAGLVLCLSAGRETLSQDQNPHNGEPQNTSAQDAEPPHSASGAATGVPIFSAVVDSSGRLIRGNGAVSARRLPNSAGRYEVTFETDVQNGTYLATIGNSSNQVEAFGVISVAQRFGNQKGVFVQTADASGNLADRGFHLLIFPAGSAIPPITHPEIRTVNVVVHRHSSVALTNAEADQILAEMGTILQTADQTGDVPTPLQFRRNGDVRLLPSNIAGVIQTQAQLDAVFAIPGIKVVRDIQFCAGPGGSIIGCAPVGSPIVNEAVVRFNSAQMQEGILWAHEYGHNAGRSHRQDDVNAVMFPSVAPNRRVVNNPESVAYLGGPQALSAPVDASAPTAVPTATTPVVAAADSEVAGNGSDETAVRPDDVREFVRQHYIEGVPFDIASSYTAEDADVLLRMLTEPGENEEFLPEIVTTLCYIGSPKAVKPVMDFAQKPAASPVAFKAQKAALMHLGDLVNKSESQAALEFLANVANAPAQARALAQPRVAAAEAVAAQEGVTPPTADELASELAVAATWGLAISGKPQAAAAISRLRAQESAAYPVVKQLAVEAAKMNNSVRTQGHKVFRTEQMKLQQPK